MIPSQNIVAWSQSAPWAEQRQIEQDLIISRALVEIFSDPFLAEELRFRGGTALNKIHFPGPLRYSEDIDLVRTSAGAIGPILDRLRALLEPWLGPANFAQSQIAPKFRFRVAAEDGGDAPIRLKLEINTREIEAYDPILMVPLPSTIRGLLEPQQSRHSQTKRCWRQSSERFCSETRAGTSMILRMV